MRRRLNARVVAKHSEGVCDVDKPRELRLDALVGGTRKRTGRLRQRLIRGVKCARCTCERRKDRPRLQRPSSRDRSERRADWPAGQLRGQKKRVMPRVVVCVKQHALQRRRRKVCGEELAAAVAADTAIVSAAAAAAATAAAATAALATASACTVRAKDMAGRDAASQQRGLVHPRRHDASRREVERGAGGRHAEVAVRKLELSPRARKRGGDCVCVGSSGAVNNEES